MPVRDKLFFMIIEYSIKLITALKELIYTSFVILFI